MKPWPTATTELAPGVFAYVQASGGFCIANAGIIAGRDATTAIDALFTPRMTHALLDEAQRVAPKPIVRLINTHHHVDHTMGNALFPADTEIVAHAKAKERMERVPLPLIIEAVKQMAPYFEPELHDIEERLPNVTFDGASMELRIDERRVRLIHYGTGHTRGDVLVHLPDERILFTGDLAFLYVTPLAMEGHIGNWIRIGRRAIDEVGADIIVGGHGPVGTKDDWHKMLDYLELIHTGARRAFDTGASEEEAIRAIDLGEFAEWGESERITPNVARCYQEFRGELAEAVAS
jgi:cyclase